jgi:hypothetical protein
MINCAVMFEHDSIADIHEGKLVQYLLGVPYWRSWMFQHSGIPENPTYRERVPLDTAPGRQQFQSDIDVVLCGHGRFEEAVVYQVKRVKVGLSQLRFSAPSKLQDLKKAVRQANQLATIGFWKVYLYVIAVIDARGQNLLGEDRALFNEVTFKIDSAIGQSIGSLDSRVGVFNVELVQTTDNPPTTIDTAHGNLRRPAIASQQSSELTRWVICIFGSDDQSLPKSELLPVQ